MSFIHTTPAEEASGDVLEMYERQQDFWGFVPNYAKVFCHRPEVMTRWGRLLAEVRRPVDDRRFEIVTLAVAHELKHSACCLAHGRRLAHIIGDDDVVAIANGSTPATLTEAEIAIMDFARKIASDASKITQADVEVLTGTHGLADEDVFDIAAIASARCFFTKILDALGSEPDVGFMKLERPLRNALTVGRPISSAAPEYTATKTVAAQAEA